MSDGASRERGEKAPLSDRPGPGASAKLDPRVEVLVLEVAEGVARDLHPARRFGRISSESRISEDLGLDSLGRAELATRLGDRYGSTLPMRALQESEILADLVRVIQEAGSEVPSDPGERAVRAREEIHDTPDDALSMVEALEWHVHRHAQRTHIVLQDEDGVELEVSYGDLRRGALEVASGLVDRGLGSGERVAIMLGTGRDFFESFYGVLYGGGVPVPIYPPLRASQIEDYLKRQSGILANAGVSGLIPMPEARAAGRVLQGRLPSMGFVESVEDLRGEPLDANPRSLPEDLALLQYTSGSTGQPRGVSLTHGNLLANVRGVGVAMEVVSTDVFVSWLPLYHDMGLIGAWLGSLYLGVLLVVMSPLRFLVRPENWLWAIHRHGGTLSAAPNFAFELCVSRVKDEEICGLDLSSMRMLLNGAEPVSPLTVRRFQERFEPYGLAPGAMAPVYGMAECAVGLAFPPPGRPAVIRRLRRELLAEKGEARDAELDEEDVLELVACGSPMPRHQIRVVDDAGHELPERREGHVLFKGPSATTGYFGDPEASEALRDRGWLRSGDRGFTIGGEIYLTGRAKDIIIRAGRNIYPQTIEEVVGEVEGVRKGCVAVFGVTDDPSQTERIVVLAETRQTEPQARQEIMERILRASGSLLDDPVDQVLLVPPHTVLKTSSGKVRRSACRALHLEGRIGDSPPRVWWQLARLSVNSVAPWFRRIGRATGEHLYAGWWWLVLVLLASSSWVAIALLPWPAGRWSVFRTAGRWLFRLTGAPVEVEGLGNLPPGGCVLVFNHTGYLDGLIAAAAIPRSLVFFAKRELQGQWIGGTLVRRLGGLFVDRLDPAGGVEDAQTAVSRARAGEVMMIFPEGTFYRGEGVLPFKLGAFMVAGRANVPIVPAVFGGTRTVLRGDQWFPRHGSLSVTIGAPIPPVGTDFASAIELRDRTRAWILERTGEPDLVQERVNIGSAEVLG